MTKGDVIMAFSVTGKKCYKCGKLIKSKKDGCIVNVISAIPFSWFDNEDLYSELIAADWNKRAMCNDCNCNYDIAEVPNYEELCNAAAEIFYLNNKYILERYKNAVATARLNAGCKCAICGEPTSMDTVTMVPNSYNVDMDVFNAVSVHKACRKFAQYTKKFNLSMSNSKLCKKLYDMQQGICPVCKQPLGDNFIMSTYPGYGPTSKKAKFLCHNKCSKYVDKYSHLPAYDGCDRSFKVFYES